MTGTVGIKQANGSFYPIVEAFSASKKRLLLTTAHDDQKSVQIDLYKSAVKSMVDALYIGSIVVENIALQPKGKASIEMTVNSGVDGSITVDVVETGNPSNEYHLSISLNSLEEDGTDYPDFEGDEDQESSRKKVQVKGRKIPWLTIALIGAVLALICLALWYFLIKNPVGMSWPKIGLTKKAAPEVAVAGTSSGNSAVTETAPEAAEPVIIERPPEPAAVAAPPESAADQTAGSQADDQTGGNQTASQTGGQSNAQAASPDSGQSNTQAANPPARRTAGRTANRINAPQTIPAEGITYRVRWGDTLWDIAEAFYRNPRLYPVIVRSNSISNPNRIISGTELIIPPKN